MAIITIGGDLGAGKTTLAASLSKALGYEELYMGGIMREAAAEQNLSIEAFYVRLKNNPDLERSMDDRQSALMQKKDDLVVQGRIAWFFAKQSPFKVFNIMLQVDPQIGAERTKEREENGNRDIAELEEANKKRKKTELERYRLLYGIDNFLDPGHYDFTLDTSHIGKDEVFSKVMEKVRETIGPRA